MIIYNVTITLDIEIAKEWQEWMVGTHIPDVMRTGMFISYRMGRLLNHEHKDSEIFTIQYIVESMERLYEYIDDYSEPLQDAHSKRYHGRYVIFRTIMDLIDQGE